MTNNSKGYTALHTHLKNFFDELLPTLIRDTDLLFQQPLHKWLKETYKDLLIIKKDDSDRYKKSVDILNRKLPGLTEIVRVSENRSRFDTIVEILLKTVEDLPEEIVEIQPDERFKSLEHDSFFTGIKKSSKRILRLLPGNIHNKEERWVQKIPLRDLVLDQLLSSSGWMETWMAESYRDTAEILELFLEKKRVEKESDDESESGVLSFKIEVIEDFEKHLEMAIKRIESEEMLRNPELDEILTDIYQEVTYVAERTGTIEGKSLKITRSGVKDFAQKQHKLFTSIERSWSRYLESQLSDLKIQTEIAVYGYRASAVQEEILKETHAYFRDYGYLPMESGVSTTREIIQALKESKNKNLSDKLVEQIRSKLERDVRKSILLPMQQPEQQQKIMDRIRDRINDLQLHLMYFSEKVELAEERDIVDGKPIVKLDELNWQSLASRFLQEKALRRMSPEKKDLVLFISEMAVEVEETIQIVDVNLMAAIESKEVMEEEQSPLDIAVGGLERALGLFENSIKNVRDKQNEYESLVNETLPGALHILADLMLNREYDKFELQDKALQVKARAIDWQQKLNRLSAEWIDKAEIIWRFSVKKINKSHTTVSYFLGFRGDGFISTTEKRNLAESLSRAAGESNLPFIYKRLFDYDFEIDWRFYVPPYSVFTMAKKAYEEWGDRLEANILLMGEKGSGKSTAVRLLTEKVFLNHEIIQLSLDKTIYKEKELIDEFCRVLNLDAVDTQEELIDQINDRKSKTIFIFENLHNAYVRNIHGFAALDCFWGVMSATKENLFWVVTTSRYSWKFFVKMSGADQFFSHIVSVDSLDKDQLQKAILNRHKSTGYNLIFEASKAIKQSRSFRKLLGDEVQIQRYLMENYFTRLSNVSEGNLSVAIIFWLQSIRDHDEYSLKIAPLEVADVDKLEIPARDVLFTLSAFVIHDRLTEQEMAMALHQNVSESRLMLTRLKSKGIIYSTRNGYQMNQLVYRQLIRLLKRRNIIH
jgi:hypothetical protein